MMHSTTEQAWKDAERALSRGDYHEAASSYRAIAENPDFAAFAFLRLSLIATQKSTQRLAVEYAFKAFERRNGDAELSAMLAKRLYSLWELEATVKAATSSEILQSKNPNLQAELGKILLDAFFPAQALKLLELASKNGLDTAGSNYLQGMSHMYLGSVALAEERFEKCIAMDKGHAHAHWALSRIKRRGMSAGHIERLAKTLEQDGTNTARRAMLLCAMFKEHDEIGEHERAWSSLKEAMILQSSIQRYDMNAEHALFDFLKKSDTIVTKKHLAADAPIPIFIVGMPRTGTTLLERMLNGHPDVMGLGELHDLVMQLRWVCDLPGSPYMDLQLAQKAVGADMSLLRERYLEKVRWRIQGRKYFVDKMPANFVNIDWIAAAFPEAKIIHMVRNPMDTCFSNLKEYFQGAYKYSNSQKDVADYYLGYVSLMNAFHARFPGRILDVEYETLVRDPRSKLLEVVGYCGLTFSDDMLGSRLGAGTIATASANQLRENVHERFVGQWRRYSAELAELRQALGV